jgi:curved DNA-binding protein CbpA
MSNAIRTLTFRTMEKNHYDVLGIVEGASGNEIKKAYRELIRIYHPDKDSGNEANCKVTDSTTYLTSFNL